MWIAHRVFERLFGTSTKTHNPSIDSRDAYFYVATCFELAALLHDVGHSAFSHSIEDVQIDGKPFFRTMAEVVQDWNRPSLKSFAADYRKHYPEEPFQHEQLGLLLLDVIFKEDKKVVEACRSTGIDPEELLLDVRSLLKTKFAPSAGFADKAAHLMKATLEGAQHSTVEHIDHLRAQLYSLISGTLDVDRLDYLVRDSFYTGVPYGVCDVEVLINALNLEWIPEEGPRLTLSLRAVGALDDMLWSRYQLFNQVLNHKTNVILNELLKDAIQDAVQSSELNLKAPRRFEDFMEFTDDRVMSEVFRACIRQNVRERRYARALVFRDLPKHLGFVNLASGETLEGAKERFAKERGIDISLLHCAKTKSHLIKGGGLPLIIYTDKNTGAKAFKRPEDTLDVLRWNRNNQLPAVMTRVHFYIDR
jgi:HD superfamily phosphohydrolase